MSFRLRFWGTRGSIPSPGPTTVRYGGNTPSIEVRTPNGSLVLLDAGTGIRELGRALIARSNGVAITGDIFLTHAHWDHIQGIPFFAPAFQRGNRFTIWGAKSLAASIRRVIRDQMSPVVFPVAFEELAATFEFRELTDERHASDGFEVRAFPVRHPGGALGYRFSSRPAGSPDSGSAFVYISDNELRATDSSSSNDRWRAKLTEFIRGSRVLIHDATYTEEEYESHRGWGHSTYGDAVALALESGVETLVLFHHSPDRSDDELDGRLAECRAACARSGRTLRVIAAAEGLEMEI
ncbi:MAG TPA: MBL fold metallo-hydrolase [Gemmatimonadaceae bacterium]|nr:MBL fold metallo-hydrolase [Gemmatimonadaceae bacterium]